MPSGRGLPGSRAVLHTFGAMSSNGKVDCRQCLHFRSAPYEAREDGCYFPGNMEAKQSATYLDEQQLAGDHEKINRRGDCTDFQARAEKLPWWRRLMDVGA